MSEGVMITEPTVLNGVEFNGLVQITEVATGMITLRGTQDGTMMTALSGLGLGLPAMRRIEAYTAGQVAWMSPDELLILCPRGAVAGILTGLTQALAGTHHMAVDVSDARAMFRVEGDEGNQVLAKLSPTDILDGPFPLGEVRRTRLAQIPAAFWSDGAGVSVICFRSVAQYAFDVLARAARVGAAL